MFQYLFSILFNWISGRTYLHVCINVNLSNRQLFKVSFCQTVLCKTVLCVFYIFSSYCLHSKGGNSCWHFFLFFLTKDKNVSVLEYYSHHSLEFTRTGLYLIPCTEGSLNHYLPQNVTEKKGKVKNNRFRWCHFKFGNLFMTPGSVVSTDFQQAWL